jgi:hypothetical protein
VLNGYTSTGNNLQLTPSDSLNQAFDKLQAQLNNKEPINTGLLSGGVLSINVDNTKFDIGSSILYFTDYSNPIAPTGSFHLFAAVSAIPVTNIATQNATYIGIDNTGAIIQQGSPFTTAQSRTIISIGAVIHSNRININTINNIGASAIDPNLQIHDLMVSVGALNIEGNIYSANGPNLLIDKSQGSLFKFGSNFQNAHNDPNTLSISQQLAVTFRYRLQNSTEYSNTTYIDPNNYDLNGVLTSVPANKFTVQRITLFQSGITRIQYGQALYSSLSEAIASYLGESFITEQNIKDNGILRGYLIVGQGVTSLLDDTKVKFFDVSKFGHSVSYHIPNEHVEINDTDITLTDIKDKVVTISNILTTRNLYLPPASIPNQQIQIVDESGKLSPTSYLHIACAGTDVIETTAYTNMTGPFESLILVSNGSGRWDIISKHALLSAGIQAAPPYTDNNNGTFTVGTGFFNLYRNANGLGSISAFSITGTTYTPVDGVTNYLVADYNNGSPILRVTQDVTIINETTIIPVLTLYRGGTSLHILEWDNLGLGLTNKIHQSIVKTQRYRREAGLGLGETGTRNVTVAGGTVWIGAVKTVLGNFNSTTDNIFINYHVGGVWTTTLVHQYDNLYYDNGTDRVTVNPNRYVVNYVYIGVESRSEAYITLGTGNYGTLAEAVNSQPGPVPPLISSHAILVGRIIVLQGANVATQIDSAFVTPFTNSLGGSHNDLAGLQGGAATEYFHLTSTQHSLATQNASTTLTGLLTNTDWNTFNAKQPALNGTGFVKIAGTTISYDNTTYAPYNQTMYIGTTATPINRSSAEQDLTGITSIDGSVLTLGGTTASTVSLGTASTTQVVNIGTGSGITTINIGGSGDTVNIAGTLAYVNTTNLQVTDKLVTVNKGGAASSGDGAGIEVEENSAISGYIKIGNTRSSWVMETPTKSGTIMMTPGASSFSSEIISTATANRTFTLQDKSGTLALTTDGVTSFNTRLGAITLTSTDVTTALTYTPVNKIGDTMTGSLLVNTGLGYFTTMGANNFMFNRVGVSYINQMGIGGSIVIQTSNVSANDVNAVNITSTGATTFVNSVTASSFVKTGGTSSQFLKADGSVDSTAYTTNVGTVTSVALTTPIGLSISGSPITTSGTLAISLTTGYAIPTTASQTNWDTAYTDRMKWDGGSTGLVASTGRISLGATTTGSNLFTLVDPAAVSYIRINADNTVSTLSATALRTAISAEPSLGNPTIDGYALTSTTLGVRSWAAMQPLNTTLTSLSALTNSPGVLTNNGSGILSWSSITSYAATIGDGTNTTITVNHSLNTTDITVAVYELTGSKRKVDSGIEIRSVDANNVSLIFNSAPALNSLRIIVMQSGSTFTANLFTNAINGYVPASGGGTVNFLRADGTWSAPIGSTTATLTIGNGLSGTSFNGSSAVTIAVSAPNNTTAATYYPVFATSQGISVVLGTNVNYTFNASTNALTIGGTLTAGNGISKFGANIAADTELQINGVSSQYRILRFTSSGSNRWAIFANSVAETGASVGSSLVVRSHDDAGLMIDDILTIPRAAGSTIAFSAARPITGLSFNSITGLATSNPLMNGVAAIGTSTLVAKQDHVHATDTSRQAALNGTGLVRMSGTTVSYDNNSYALTNQTMYIGTTAVAINRASSALSLTGVSIDGNAATATNVVWTGITSKPTTLLGYAITDIRNLGSFAVQAVAGTNQSCTTAQFITWLQSIYNFKNYMYTFGKCTWDYAGNNDISDTVVGAIEMAGCTVETFSDGAQYTIRIIRPNTGTGPSTELVYNDQGAGYSPGWRVALNNNNYNSYAPSLTGTGASGSWGISVTGSSASCTGNAATATALMTSGVSNTFAYSNSSNSPTYLWATDSNGSSYLAARGSISVNYASTSGTATNVSGGTVSTTGITISASSPNIQGIGSGSYDFLLLNRNAASVFGVYGNTINSFASGAFQVLSTAASTSVSTGALVVTGGAGINGAIYSGGIVYASDFSASSDARYKKEITKITNALDKLDKINGVTYKWNSQAPHSDTKEQVGVLAQEVIEVLPQAVETNEDGYMSVSYGKIVPLLIEAIKELKAEIEILKGGR